MALLASALLFSVALAAHSEERFPEPAAKGVAAGLAANLSTPVFINEIHYDNDGTDVGEGVEIAGPAGTDLTGWTIVAYNGNGGAPYGTTNLSGTIPDQQAGYGTLFFTIAGLQNGAPDGIALVNGGAAAVQFLSYEGSFVAVGGAANGTTSVDIGVAEAGTAPVGSSACSSGGLVLSMRTLCGVAQRPARLDWSTRGSPLLPRRLISQSPNGLSQTCCALPRCGNVHGDSGEFGPRERYGGSHHRYAADQHYLRPVGAGWQRPAPRLLRMNMTWTGSVAAGQLITFTFVVSHTGGYGDVVTNTVEYNGTSGSGSAQAAFETLQEFLVGDLTFVYHDPEDVVLAGVKYGLSSRRFQRLGADSHDARCWFRDLFGGRAGSRSG